MRIRPIHNEKDHQHALIEINRLWGAKDGSEDAHALELWITLVDLYESQHHKILPPDPIEAIRFRMEQEGLTRKDLEPMIGSRARVSEIMNRKRPLTLPMIRSLRSGLKIPADVLVGDDQTAG